MLGMLTLLLIALALPAGRRAMVYGARWLDDNLGGQHCREAWGRLRWREDWSSVPDAHGFDYNWLPEVGPIRIAHALGASGGVQQNSLAAFDDSIRANFQLLEVDFWLDPIRGLQCHHEDSNAEDGVAANAIAECDGAGLLQTMARTPKAWLGPDLEGDFVRTGKAVLDAARREGVERRLIFQIYSPQDANVFSEWQRKFGLPGPIVTTYRAHRPIWSVLPALEARGYRAVALPMDSMPMIPSAHGSARLLVHPIRDCPSMRRAIAAGIDGFYMLNNLPC